MMTEIIKGSPTYLAKVAMDIPQVKRCVFTLVMNQINEQCRKLCAKTTEKPSVLRVSRKAQKNLSTFKWIDILREMRERAPDVLDFLVTIGVSHVKEDGSQVAPLCVAFGILMNVRSRELSMVQKIATVILGSGNATKRYLDFSN